MIAIEISKYGDPDVLRPVERPIPQVGDNDVLIRVEAAGVSRADLLQRQGKYPPPAGASDIPGLDVAGVVEAVGSQVGTYSPGNRVCAIVAGGGYAEHAAVPVQQVLPIPEGWTSVEAATLPENLFTAYDNVITRGDLTAGEVVLIHGGASGVGSTAIMLARAVRAIPIATAGSEDKVKACIKTGAAHAINYKQSDFVAEVKAFTDGRGANVILDMVGGEYLERNLDALALEGRLVLIAMQRGRVGQLDIGRLLMKRGQILGSTMRARTPDEKGAVAQALLRHIWPILPAKDVIRPVIDSTFPLTEAAKAHTQLEQGNHVGKIVLAVAPK